jgi:hypothetical protein
MISTHSEFLPCIENLLSPFKLSKTVLQHGIDPDKNKSIVIKCKIVEEDQEKLGKVYGLSSDTICYEALEQFVKEHLSAKNLSQAEILVCNRFEKQYKYIIVP